MYELSLRNSFYLVNDTYVFLPKKEEFCYKFEIFMLRENEIFLSSLEKREKVINNVFDLSEHESYFLLPGHTSHITSGHLTNIAGQH